MAPSCPMGRRTRILAAVALLALSGCGKVQRGWSIEPPAPQYASGPTQTGRTTELRVTPEGANYLCHTAGVWMHEPTGFPVACYNPKTDQVILPDKWPSQVELNQMRAHEWAHARLWRHNEDGSGTGPASQPPPAWTNPGFNPNDPQNPAPVYRGPPPPQQAGLLAALPAPLPVVQSNAQRLVAALTEK